MTVVEEEFDEILAKFDGGKYFTRGFYGEKGKGSALLMIDPDGNEAEINPRYLYGVPQRVQRNRLQVGDSPLRTHPLGFVDL